MNKEFNVGDLVEVLDDAFSGKIVKITKTEVIIETADGFELSYQPHELIFVGEPSVIKSGTRYSDVEHAKNDKIIVNHHRVNQDKKSKKEEFVLEVDLHIEKLVKSFKHMTNFDILNIQLDTARGQLEFAIKNRIPKMVLIHGMGEGVLKTELEFLLGRYSEITFQEANYRKYGLGATEVYIKQNPNR